MIEKQELIAKSIEWNLPIHTVEKDYVLGLILYGIANHPDLKENWVFKGGTCIKKCYIAGYRFSEDLDFTLLSKANLDPQIIHSQLNEVSEIVLSSFGLVINVTNIKVSSFPDKHGLFLQAKLPFRGPVSISGSYPNIKFDLSAEEKLVDTTERKKLLHNYSDANDGICEILSYSFSELFAEKLRALTERARPRDLYDVVNLYDCYQDFDANLEQIKRILKKKFDHRGLTYPTDLQNIPEHQIAELKVDWDVMLKHQLANLESANIYLERFEGIKNVFR
jgi:predicted nucleotidyltransferase component of viral defense system